jgi:hypothetical protein
LEINEGVGPTHWEIEGGPARVDDVDSWGCAVEQMTAGVGGYPKIRIRSPNT